MVTVPTVASVNTLRSLTRTLDVRSWGRKGRKIVSRPVGWLTGPGEMHRHRRSGGGRRVARADRRIAAVTAGLALAVVAAACGGSSKPHTAPTTVTSSPPTGGSTSTTTSSATSRSTATTIDSPVGAQAFAAWQHASSVVAQIEGDPTGTATDSRLAQNLVAPALNEVADQIVQLRLHGYVLRGPYSFSNFRLDDVTADGRVIFTDCQRNTRQLYNSKTGELIARPVPIGNMVVTPGPSQVPEQVVIYHPTSTSPWRVADDNTNTAGSAHACE
jgi:hypothetical protein